MTAVSLNQDQRLFVIPSGGGYSCLGFDVVYNYITEFASRIAKAGRAISVTPQSAEIGTLKQYEDYLSLLQEYRAIEDKETWFDARTPEQVRKVLEAYRKSGNRVRIFLGDESTGRDWMDEHDMMGRIGRSMGPMKSPLLISDDEDGGPALLTSCIVRIVDVTTRKDVYRHPQYHLPEMELRSISDEDGYTDSKGKYVSLAALGYSHGVWVKNQNGLLLNHANFKSYGKACNWMAFMSGDSFTQP
ncbi:uncharacterized protein NMK_1982 [Novimethylophilus kurashikiensis]|uniref:Uncharacterized protein n=1 Tax=Novimethylophilus kurashikiensis TaxID=1825523 RepID=A0A2R5FBV0_9PROT|nr:hypothetical protein [Novimethylophilus kurashikiensis]GBG14383.1 uncharacterized protein NMK_1982 [Novimethylophilus kurashikiensis]